jgi:hypothetical protein
VRRVGASAQGTAFACIVREAISSAQDCGVDDSVLERLVEGARDHHVGLGRTCRRRPYPQRANAGRAGLEKRLLTSRTFEQCSSPFLPTPLIGHHRPRC